MKYDGGHQCEVRNAGRLQAAPQAQVPPTVRYLFSNNEWNYKTYLI